MASYQRGTLCAPITVVVYFWVMRHAWSSRDALTSTSLAAGMIAHYKQGKENLGTDPITLSESK